MKSFILTFTIVAAVLAADWPQYKQNPAHTGVSPDDSIGRMAVAGSLAQNHSVSLGRRIWASPVVSGDTLYIGTTDGFFYALNAARLSQIYWKATLAKGIYSTAAVGGGRIAVGCLDGRLYLFKPDGTFDTFATQGEIWAPITYAPGKNHFIVPSCDGRVYAVTPSGGQDWVYLDTSACLTPQNLYGVAWEGGQLAVPYGDARLHYLEDLGLSVTILHARDICAEGWSGSRAWTGTPTIYGGKIFMSNRSTEGNRSMGARSRLDGAFLWNRTCELMGGVAAADGRVYLQSLYSRATALDTADGLLRSVSDATRSPNRSGAGVVLGRECLVSVRMDGILEIRTRDSASFILYSHTFAEGVGSFSTPAISGSRVYFGADNGCLYSYGHISGATGQVNGKVAEPVLDACKLTVEPNPFNPTARINYAIPERARVSLVLLNAAGRQIRVLIEGMKEAGFHRFRLEAKDLDASGLASGGYFLVLKAGQNVKVKPLFLLR